jgi:RNA polymerase sigma-70 factor (ECF subfamily)
MDPATERPETERDSVLAAVRERIVAYAASRLSRDRAEDLAQEVLLVIHEKYRAVREMEELFPLCMQILRYKMMAHFRKSARHGDEVPAEDYPLADNGENPEDFARRREISVRLAAAVKKLGAECRKLMRLKLEGRTFPEIQTLLGARSINTVYTWDFRCRKHLLELMGGSWEART